MRALDLFAGAGGWDVAARELGIDCDGVEIMPEARATRAANGLNTSAVGDVWEIAEDLSGIDVYDGLIASPPCQTFSMAGKGAGRKALDDVLDIISYSAYEDSGWLRERAKMLGDERTALVLVPLLFWHHMRPKWVAFEQVPAVLPVWEAMADHMRAAGYSVWTGNLHAEQYGVPQTRKRAILMAKRCDCTHNTNCVVHDSCIVHPPTPTHSKYYPRDKTRLDPGVKPWVSMAEALGWSDVEVRSNYGTGGDPANRGVRDASEPSATVTEKVGRNKIQFAGAGRTAVDTAGQVRRNSDEPGHTITGKGTAAWVQDRQLGQGRLERHGKPVDRTTDEPSYSMRGQASGSAPGGGYVLRNNNTANAAEREMEQPAPTLYFGQRSNYCAWETPSETTSRRVTVGEAAILQGFPPDFVFCGGGGKQYLQVGNACPPRLAYHILKALTGVSHSHKEWE